MSQQAKTTRQRSDRKRHIHQVPTVDPVSGKLKLAPGVKRQNIIRKKGDIKKLDYERSSDSSGEEGQEYSDFQNKEFKENSEAQLVRRELRRLRREVRRDPGEKLKKKYADVQTFTDPEERRKAFEKYEMVVKTTAVKLYNKNHKEKIVEFKRRDFAKDGKRVPLDKAPFEYTDDENLDEEIVGAEGLVNEDVCTSLKSKECKEERARCVYYFNHKVNKNRCNSISNYVFGAIHGDYWTVRRGSYSLLFRALTIRPGGNRLLGSIMGNRHILFLQEFDKLVKAVDDVLKSLPLPRTHRHFNLLRALGRYLVIHYVRREKVSLAKDAGEELPRAYYPESFEKYEALVKQWLPDTADHNRLFASLIVRYNEWFCVFVEWKQAKKDGSTFPSILRDVITQAMQQQQGTFIRIYDVTNNFYTIQRNLTNWIALGASGFFLKWYNRMTLGRIGNQRAFPYPLVTAPNLETMLGALLFTKTETDANAGNMAADKDVIRDVAGTNAVGDDAVGDDMDGVDADSNDADGNDTDSDGTDTEGTDSDDADGDGTDGDDADGDGTDSDDADGDDVVRDDADAAQTDDADGDPLNKNDKHTGDKMDQPKRTFYKQLLQRCNPGNEESTRQIRDALQCLEPHLSHEDYFQVLLFLGWAYVFYRLILTKMRADVTLDDKWYVETYEAASVYVESVLPAPAHLHWSVFMTLVYMHVGKKVSPKKSTDPTNRPEDEETGKETYNDDDKDDNEEEDKDDAMDAAMEDVKAMDENAAMEEEDVDDGQNAPLFEEAKDLETKTIEERVEVYSSCMDLTKLRNELFPQAETQLSETKTWFRDLSDPKSSLSRQIAKILDSKHEDVDAVKPAPPVMFRPMNLEQLSRDVTTTTDILFYPCAPLVELDANDVDRFFQKIVRDTDPSNDGNARASRVKLDPGNLSLLKKLQQSTFHKSRRRLLKHLEKRPKKLARERKMKIPVEREG